MGSTSALLTGLSGLNAHTRRLEVIGNNIANINTNAFKSNRLTFAPALSRNFSLGTAPSGVSGGSNPAQVGLGVTVAGTQRNFSGGSINTTGVKTDLAIDGDGLFIVNRAGQQYFTRDGSFLRNSSGELVTLNGERVQGYAVDDTFNVIKGELTDLNIPLGKLTFAEPTTQITLQGNLNADRNNVANSGTLITFNQPFAALGGGFLASTDPIVGAAGLEDPNSAGNPLFPTANAPFTLTISGGDGVAEKGGKEIPDRSLAITTATTIDDLIEFVNDTFGVVDGLTNNDGTTAGATYNATTGVFSVVGNHGAINDLIFDGAAISIEDVNGATVGNPFTTTRVGIPDSPEDADSTPDEGESTRAEFVVYDSLGNKNTINMSLVLESTTNTGDGSTWRYFIDSPDNLNVTNPDYNFGTGLISFDENGQLLTTTPITAGLNLDGAGSTTPMTFTLDFTSSEGTVSAYASDKGSSLSGRSNGTGVGTLFDFSVGLDGVITGSFDNGITKTIGQVVVATFANNEGLVDAGNNLFSVGPNSGTPLVTEALNFGTGRIIGGALEGSNTDLGQEFINMILTTTGYTASSRVITTSDQLLQQLVTIGR